MRRYPWTDLEKGLVLTGFTVLALAILPVFNIRAEGEQQPHMAPRAVETTLRPHATPYRQQSQTCESLTGSYRLTEWAGDEELLKAIEHYLRSAGCEVPS